MIAHGPAVVLATTFVVLGLVLLAHGGIVPAATAAVPTECQTFSWDVTREFALFEANATTIELGRDPETAPVIQVDAAYTSTLHPQAEVTLVAPRPAPAPDAVAYAGIAAVRIAKAGRYRVSGSGAYRIDVVHAGVVVPALAFQGSPACPLIRKSVAFDLPAGAQVWVQIAESGSARTRIAITPVVPAS